MASKRKQMRLVVNIKSDVFARRSKKKDDTAYNTYLKNLAKLKGKKDV